MTAPRTASRSESGQQVALYVVLVAAEGLQPNEYRADDQKPLVVFGGVPLPAVDLELAALPGGRKDLRGVGIGPEQNEQDAEQPPSHQEDALNDVGPDHGLDAADQGVEHGNRSQDQDHAGDVPPRQQGRGQRQKVVGDADVGHPADQKGGGAVGARGGSRTAVPGIRRPSCARCAGRTTRCVGPAAASRSAGPVGGDQKQCCRGRRFRGVPRKWRSRKWCPGWRRPPPSPDAACSQKVVLGGLLPPGEIDPHRATPLR